MTTEPAPEAPRVGGYVTYRKPGQQKRKALIEWVHPDGSMRVRPAVGRRTTDHAARRRPRTTGSVTQPSPSRSSTAATTSLGTAWP